MRYLWIALTIINCSACQVTQPQGEQAPAYHAVAAGARLVLTQDITIPAHQSSVFIQDGKLTTSSVRNRYYPNCKFELYSLSEQSRLVRADTFTIVRVSHSSELVARAAPLYAGRVGDRSGGPMAAINAVIFHLQAKAAVDAFRLSCEHWTDPVLDTDLSLAEVRQTLRPLFMLELN